MPSYQLASKVNRADTDVLVVHCSDHRIQAGIREFLDQGLKLEENYDLLILPGGPQGLTLVEYLPKFAWASWRWFQYLLDHHELRRMILIAHQECGWYKELPLHLHASSEPRERQEQDLRRARNFLLKEFPTLSVELYYVGWDDNDRVTVEVVSA